MLNSLPPEFVSRLSLAVGEIFKTVIGHRRCFLHRAIADRAAGCLSISGNIASADPRLRGKGGTLRQLRAIGSRAFHQGLKVGTAGLAEAQHRASSLWGQRASCPVCAGRRVRGSVNRRLRAGCPLAPQARRTVPRSRCGPRRDPNSITPTGSGSRVRCNAIFPKTARQFRCVVSATKGR